MIRKVLKILQIGGKMKIGFALKFFTILSTTLIIGNSVCAQTENMSGIKGRFIKTLLENKQKNKENPNFNEEGLYKKGTGTSHNETLGNRSYIVYTPKNLPPKGNIPLLIVLHGGFGNAGHIQNYIGLDPLADDNQFIVAYLNGTQVARKLPEKMQGWNAGDCCGQPAANKVDDIGFISNVISNISEKYGIDPSQVYGTGHSNGGMMTQRILCETDLYKNGVSLSGTLQMDTKICPAASGNHVVNIHGSEDENLPVEGGHTKTGINKRTNYKSQTYTKTVFNESGASYDLILLQGANHSPETLNGALIKTEGLTLPQKIVKTLGLGNN